MAIELQELLNRYKTDKESVFNSWFINNDERLKAFRSIRRGVQKVVQDIKTAIKSHNVEIRYILFSDLRQHCDALCKFGESKEILKKIAKMVD